MEDAAARRDLGQPLGAPEPGAHAEPRHRAGDDAGLRRHRRRPGVLRRRSLHEHAELGDPGAGAAALVAQLSAHEAGAAVAPQLVITPFTFTDSDATDDNDDQDAPLSFTVDTAIVPQNPPLPSPTPGGPDRPLVAMVAADGTEIEFTDSELVVLTSSAAE